MLQQLKQQAKVLKNELRALYLAYQDPRVPWYAKLVVACVVAYALSPIDLIPDPIPVLGYLDDLILIPLGIKLALKMIPAQVMADCRMQAQTNEANGQHKGWIAAVVVVSIWILVGIAIALWIFPRLRR